MVGPLHIFLTLFSLLTSLFITLFFLFFSFHLKSVKIYSGTLGFALISSALLVRFLDPGFGASVVQCGVFLAFILILYAFMGKDNLLQAIQSAKSAQEQDQEIFDQKKKKKEIFSVAVSLSNPYLVGPLLLSVGSFLLIVGGGAYLVLKGNRLKDAIHRMCGIAFIFFGFAELAHCLFSQSSVPNNLSSLIYIAGFSILIYTIRQKISLTIGLRFFLTGLSLTFVTLLILNILIFALLASIVPESMSSLFVKSMILGTLSVFVLLSIPCWLVSRSFSRPLRQLIDYTKILKEGNLEPMQLTLSNIEYNEILEGLNLMVRAIKRNREDLESQISQLKELDKLREQFLANVSHELRTPLTMIIGNTELILAGLIGEISEEQKEFLQPVFDEAHKLLQLITDVLNFSKIERGVSELYLENTNLREIARQVITEFAPLARLRKIQVFQEVPDLNFAADVDKFKQIMVHLISNALKFNGKEGKVRIKGRLKKKTSENDVDQIEVQIADTGIGIRPEFLATMFEKFRQGDGSATREYGGTGIGLTIVKSFTEMHEGTIEVKSVVGKGTQFTITIPHRVLESSDTVSDTVLHSTEQSLAPASPEKILVVIIESDLYISKLLKTYLVQDGYNVLALSAGKESFEQIQHLKPHAICLNPVLPDINGWELLKRLKEHSDTGHIPVVIVSVLEKRKFAHKLGANDYIVLPVSKSKFIETIQKNLSVV